MIDDKHQRALGLIDAAHIEGISAVEQAWLEGHLEECARCREGSRATEEALRSLRSVLVPISPSLVSATQQRVHVRAEELRDQRSRLRALWFACGLSWVLGVVSAPFVWRAFEWVGQRADLPTAVWETAFFLSWLVPAAVVGGVFAWWRAHPSVNDLLEACPTRLIAFAPAGFYRAGSWRK